MGQKGAKDSACSVVKTRYRKILAVLAVLAVLPCCMVDIVRLLILPFFFFFFPENMQDAGRCGREVRDSTV